MNNEIKKFQNAFKGIGIFFRNARHAKWHMGIACITIAAGWYFCISTIEWGLIIMCIGFVFATEAINESIERICNFIHPEIHSDIGKIKDIAAGAVLIAAFTSAIVGVIIFLPEISDAF